MLEHESGEWGCKVEALETKSLCVCVFAYVGCGGVHGMPQNVKVKF